MPSKTRCNDYRMRHTITKQSFFTSIICILQHKASLGLPTVLSKIRGYTNIRGNDLADKAAKLLVLTFGEIPEKNSHLSSANKLKDQHIGSCTLIAQLCHQFRSPPAHTRPCYAPLCGQYHKQKDNTCTPSPTILTKSDIKSATQPSEAYTTPPSTNASYLKRKLKGPA